MKKILLTIIGMILLIPSISNAADEEVVWELEGVWPGIEDIIVSNTQDIFYHTYYGTIQIRSINDGQLLDSIVIDEYRKGIINKISISDDDRFLAISGNIPHIIIWDLENKREYKKISKIVYYGDSAFTWKSVSISPDGSKLTAIAVIEPAGVTELVVFDLETEEAILSELRNIYDNIKGVYYGTKWVSTEFSPSGEYLVTELGVNWDRQNGQVVLDSVYVYKTSDYKINDTFLNNFDEKDIAFSSYENVISSNYGRSTKIYNLENKELINVPLDRQPYSVLFSRINSSKILLSLGTRSYIYDYTNKKEIYSYENNIYAKVILKDDSKIIGHGSKGLVCLKTFWTTTSVESILSQTNISPNPTSSFVNIDLNCSEPVVDYQITDISGARVSQTTIANQDGSLQIDFSAYTTGVYFLTINCKEPVTYKIIKE
ncbi:MAG: T9SS type A sorting domain-containing protein [Candidatus Kapaibacterium sp.]